jgi:riboflavin kinase, archaea type
VRIGRRQRDDFVNPPLADSDDQSSTEEGRLRPARDWCMTILRGRVASGVGDLANRMTEYADLYAAKTGEVLYPGSLNVHLAEPWHVGDGATRVEPPECPVAFSIVPCTIGGLDAFIIRTDRNDRGEGDHPPTVIEVAATVRLRDALNVEDGDEVEVVAFDPFAP